jgi:hypothetical protein
VGVGRGADMSLKGFHSLQDKILSQKVQAVADQGCQIEGFAPYKWTAYRGLITVYNYFIIIIIILYHITLILLHFLLLDII